MSASSATAVSPSARRNSHWITSGSGVVTVIALLKFLLEMCGASRYGIFRDEMYYVACGQHLGWGYVDHPPLWPFVAWLLSHSIGTSLIALRLVSGLCGAALILVTGAIARQMGGDRMAQARAALAVVAAPIYLLMQHWFTMNAAAGQVDNPWSREDEHFTIWLCRGLTWDFRAMWPQMKKWG